MPFRTVKKDLCLFKFLLDGDFRDSFTQKFTLWWPEMCRAPKDCLCSLICCVSSPTDDEDPEKASAWAFGLQSTARPLKVIAERLLLFRCLAAVVVSLSVCGRGSGRLCCSGSLAMGSLGPLGALNGSFVDTALCQYAVIVEHRLPLLSLVHALVRAASVPSPRVSGETGSLFLGCFQ